MILEGKLEVRAPREKLWEFIVEPARISRCLPDLKSMSIESEDKFTAVIRVGVGLIKADFKFKIQIVGREPVTRVQLKAAGSGSGSSINLDLSIELREIAGGSELDYSADAKVGGMIASLGQRVIKDTAEKMVTGIFSCIRKEVE